MTCTTSSFWLQNGRYVLALWIAASSYDAASRQSRNVALQTIALQVAVPSRSAAVYAYGADWSLRRTPLSTTAPLRVTIGDRVTLVELVPAHA